MQCSQLADLHRELAITPGIQLARLRPSPLHDCLDMYLVSMKSDENWAWKEKNKLSVALNAVRQKAPTIWTDRRTLEQPAAQTRQDQQNSAEAQMHSQSQTYMGRYWARCSQRTGLVHV